MWPNGPRIDPGFIWKEGDAMLRQAERLRGRSKGRSFRRLIAFKLRRLAGWLASRSVHPSFDSLISALTEPNH